MCIISAQFMCQFPLEIGTLVRYALVQSWQLPKRLLPRTAVLLFFGQVSTEFSEDVQWLPVCLRTVYDFTVTCGEEVFESEIKSDACITKSFVPFRFYLSGDNQPQITLIVSFDMYVLHNPVLPGHLESVGMSEFVHCQFIPVKGITYFSLEHERSWLVRIVEVRTSPSLFLEEFPVWHVHPLAQFLKWLWTQFASIWICFRYFCDMLLHCATRRVLFVQFVMSTIQCHDVIPHEYWTCHELWQFVWVFVHVESVFVVQYHIKKNED